MSQNFYHENQENHHDGESPIYKRAEVIIIDDRIDQQEGDDRSAFSDEEGRAAGSDQKQSSLSLRYTCMLGLVFCSIFGFGMLLLSILMTMIATISLFQNKELNATAGRFWSLVGNTAVAGFGFILGLINPRFGLSLVLLYFSMSDEQSIDDDILSQIFRHSTKGFS
jgi:hypothetical protein